MNEAGTRAAKHEMIPSWMKRSLFNLWRKPFRTFLVVVFLSLMVGLFTVMATINRLAARQFAELEGKLETMVDIRPIGSLGLGGRRSNPLPFALENQIRKTHPDLRVDPYLIHRELDEGKAQFYVGVRPGSPLLAVGDPEPMDRRLIAGRAFSPVENDQRVAVIGLDLARERGFGPNNFTGNFTIRINDLGWQVIGIFDGGNGFTNGQVFLPFDRMSRDFKAKALSRVVVRAPSAKRAWAFAEIMKEELSGRADVVTNQPAVLLAQASLAGISGTTGMGAGLFFIAGGLVVMGAMILAFRDQTREVGVEKALGASNAFIARRLLTESLVLSLFGSLGGLGVAWVGLSVYARSWTSIKFGLVQSALSPLSAAVILLACLALGVLGSLYPIVKSLKLDPVTILREE